MTNSRGRFWREIGEVGRIQNRILLYFHQLVQARSDNQYEERDYSLRSWFDCDSEKYKFQSLTFEVEGTAPAVTSSMLLSEDPGIEKKEFEDIV